MVACWLPKAGGGMGGGRGGIPASFPSRSPPPKQPFQPTHAFARLPPSLGGFCGEKAPGPWWAGPQALGGPGPKLPENLAHRPLDPGSRHSASQTHHGSGSKTLGCYHNPQSADLGGRWMVSEGGALQSHERRGHFSRWARPQAPQNLV